MRITCNTHPLPPAYYYITSCHAAERLNDSTSTPAVVFSLSPLRRRTLLFFAFLFSLSLHPDVCVWPPSNNNNNDALCRAAFDAAAAFTSLGDPPSKPDK